VFFPGLFPIPRFHEDEFHEDKPTTPVLPLYPPLEGDRGGGRGILSAIRRITRINKMKIPIRFHNVLIGQYQSVFGNKKPSTPGNLSLSVLKRSMRHILCVVRIVGKIKKSLQSSSFLFYYHLLLRKKQFPIIYHLKVQEQGGVKCQL